MAGHSVLFAAFVAMAGASAPTVPQMSTQNNSTLPAVWADPELAGSAEFIQNIDVQLIFSDRAYAEEALRHLDRLEELVPPSEGDVAAGVHSLRALALSGLGRESQAAEALDFVIASGTDRAEHYILAWDALSPGDADRMLRIIEASRHVPEPERHELYPSFEQTIIFMLNQHFQEQDDEERQERLTEALVAIDWPGPTASDARDSFRRMAVERRLERGDRRAAAELASRIAAPGSLLAMLVQRKYDPLWPADFDREEHLSRALQEHDRATAAVLAEAPDDHIRILNRVWHLRSRGEAAEAYALLQRFTEDVSATVAADEQGMWLINEAAYALLELGRGDDAVALMNRLAAEDVAARTDLIGPIINRISILTRAGRPQEALESAVQVDRDLGHYANAYGRMWIAASAVCALAELGRAEEAESWLANLRAGFDDNPAAATQAHLCLGDLDTVEDLVVRRLEGDDPKSMLLALQDYSADEASSNQIVRRLRTVRDRPRVRSALDRVGRIMNLPLSQTYWGVS